MRLEPILSPITVPILFCFSKHEDASCMFLTCDRHSFLFLSGKCSQGTAVSTYHNLGISCDMGAKYPCMGDIPKLGEFIYPMTLDPIFTCGGIRSPCTLDMVQISFSGESDPLQHQLYQISCHNRSLCTQNQ